MIAIPFRSTLAVLANDDTQSNTGAAVPILTSLIQAKCAVAFPVTNHNAPLNDDGFDLTLSDNFAKNRTRARRRRRRRKLFRLCSVQKYAGSKSTNNTRRNTAKDCSILAVLRMSERCYGEREHKDPDSDGS